MTLPSDDSTPPLLRHTAGPESLRQRWQRWALIGFGWLMVGIGAVGVVVPGLPTTVFLLIALWAFSNSSEKFQAWLWDHPKFGPPVRAWHLHKVISPRAKALAAITMLASFVYITFFVAEDWQLPTLMAAILIPSAAYVLSRASHVPAVAESVEADQNPPAGGP